MQWEMRGREGQKRFRLEIQEMMQTGVTRTCSHLFVFQWKSKGAYYAETSIPCHLNIRKSIGEETMSYESHFCYKKKLSGGK